MLLGLLGMFASCQKSATTDTTFALYYNGVSEICPGTVLNVSPTWHGETPSQFAITGIKHNGRTIQSDCFTLNEANGQFGIRNSETLPTGKYVISVSCYSEGVRHDFKDAIEINLMKPIPAGIVVTPATLTLDREAILDNAQSLPTAQITTDGSNHVSIKQYLIANIWFNGVLSTEAKDWFDLSPSGVVSVVPGSDVNPGVYVFDFRLTTYATGLEAEEGLFEKALALHVTSAPLELVYPNPNGKVEAGYGAASARPSIKGSQEELRFSLKEVKPDNSIGITVDDATGVIRFPETDKSTVGDQYSVSVTVTNKYGSRDFDDVFNYTVIEFLYPVTKLSYADLTGKISGVSISHPVTAVDGDDVEFFLVDLDEKLSALTINRGTGEITCPKGVEIAPGTYTVHVLARNIKSEVSASFQLTIVPNPYKFTYVRWGNNMGLTPLEQYGNQWRISKEDGTLTVPVVESDIPSGVPVSYKMTIKTQNSNQRMGTTIDADTGTVTIEYQGGNNDKSARAHAAIITVTVGGDSEAAVTKNIPFFVSHQGYNVGYRIEFTPFVFRVNPKTGGSSVAPVVSREDGQPVSGFTLSYRRNIYFYNISGPEQHLDGRPGDGKTTFLYGVWDKYFSARNALVNTGSCSPVSYQGDKNGERGWLGLTACYMDPETLTMVVNPDKFSDDYGYANGIISGTMQYNINNIDPVNVGGTECFPLLIWLDPDFNN